MQLEKLNSKDKNIIRLARPPNAGDVLELPRRKGRQTLMVEGCRSYENQYGQKRHLVLWSDVDTDRLWISGLFAHNLVECGEEMEGWIMGRVERDKPPENKTFRVNGPPKVSKWKTMTDDEINEEVERVFASAKKQEGSICQQ